MKKNKFFIAILLLAAGLVACKKDFLERTPQTSISDGDFWRSPNDLRLYVNSFYNDLPSYIQGYFTAGIFSEDDYQGTDNMVNRNYNRELNGERTLPSSGGGWSYGDWNAIRRVNYFLGKYQLAEGNQADIDKYLGEALFFKAWNYYGKLKAWGNLPWISNVVGISDSTELYSPRLSRDIVADSIIAVLDKAIELLPSKGAPGFESFRVYKELAAAFQSRVALYEGTWEKYHAGTEYGVAGSDGTRFLQKAVSAAKLVMDSKKFGLDNIGEPNGYWRLFNQTNYAGSNEVMFWRQYNADDGNYTLIARYLKLGGGRGITKSLVDDYLSIDGLPIAVSPLYEGDETLLKEASNRDPRLAQTIQINDGEHYLIDTVRFWHPTWEGANEDKDYTGYQLYKGLNTDGRQHEVGKGTQGLIYFRYAEVLLNYMEAKAELGQATQEDADATINLLRSRVGMPPLAIASIVTDPNWIFPALSPLINEVRRERRIEFAAEGYRHDDIWRWAAADKLIKGWKPKGAKRAQFENMTDANGNSYKSLVEGQYPVDENGYIFPYKNNVVGMNGYNFRIDRDYLLPLPTDQLLLNPNLEQNPGWE